MPIIYLLLLTAAAIFYTLYVDRLSFILLMTMLIVPIFLMIQLIVTSLAIRIKIKEMPSFCIRGEKAKILISIENPLVIPAGRINAEIKCSDSTVRSYEISCGIKPRSSAQLCIEITPAHCGLLKISVSKPKIHDISGMFGRRLKFKAECECRVLPTGIPKEISEEACGEAMPPQNQSKSVPPGYDSLREYRLGDRIRDIHWKLSASRNNIYVKEYERLSEIRLFIIPDIFACRTRAEIDRVLDIFVSLTSISENESPEFAVLIPNNEAALRIEYARFEEEIEEITAALVDCCFEPENEIRSSLCKMLCEGNAEIPPLPVAVITPSEESSNLAAIMLSSNQPLTAFNTGKKGSVEYSAEADYSIIEAGNNSDILLCYEKSLKEGIRFALR